MTQRLVWTPQSLRDLRKLDVKPRQRILEALERFAATGIGDVKRLQGLDPPEWRLRVGRWRIRFRQSPESSSVEILRVLGRDKAYR